jgi:hypothetical protein
MAVVEGSYHLSRGRGSSLSRVGTIRLECSVLECGQVYNRVRRVAVNVFCSGSSSQRHDSKRTAAHDPKQCLPSARPKLSATNSKYFPVSCLLQPAQHFSCVCDRLNSFGIIHIRMNTKPRLFKITFLISDARESQPCKVSEGGQPSTNLNTAA